MSDQKLPFKQISQDLGIHPNTLKNWQKAGRLPSAEKVKVNGKFTWLVDPDEAIHASRQPDKVLDNEPYNSSEQSTFTTGADSQSNNSGPTAYLMELQSERGTLLDKIYNLESALRDASYERGRLEGLETQIDRLEQQINRLEGDRGGLVRAIALLFVLLVVALVVLVILVLVLKV